MHYPFYPSSSWWSGRPSSLSSSDVKSEKVLMMIIIPSLDSFFLVLLTNSQDQSFSLKKEWVPLSCIACDQTCFWVVLPSVNHLSLKMISWRFMITQMLEGKVSREVSIHFSFPIILFYDSTELREKRIIIERWHWENLSQKDDGAPSLMLRWNLILNKQTTILFKHHHDACYVFDEDAVKFKETWKRLDKLTIFRADSCVDTRSSRCHVRGRDNSWDAVFF
jgi:hypothetical protein